MCSAGRDSTKGTVLLACYFVRSLEAEGVGGFVGGLATGLTKMGYEVTLLRPEGSPPLNHHVTQETYQRGWGALGRYCRQLRELSRTCEAALLVENNPNMGFLAGMSGAAKTFCYFYTPLLIAEPWAGSRQALLHRAAKAPIWSRVQDWSQRRCIVATEYQGEQLEALGAKHITVLPAGSVSAQQGIPTHDEARRVLQWDDTPVVGYLGHFSPAKGVGVLLEAFARNASRARLAVAHSGKGCLKAKQRELLDALAADGRLRQSGMVDPYTFFAACDVVVFPYVTSSNHHLPVALVEALAAGRPIITSRVGGIGGLIEEHGAGIVVSPRNARSLRQAIEELIRSPELRKGIGTRARELFVRRLSAEVLVKGLDRLFQGKRL